MYRVCSCRSVRSYRVSYHTLHNLSSDDGGRGRYGSARSVGLAVPTQRKGFASATGHLLPRPAGAMGAVAGPSRVPFYMHTDPALDHGWLRHCPGFALLARSAYNERLAEVYVRDALAVHPWRTDGGF